MPARASSGWETKVHDPESGALHTSAPIVVEGKVITGRACTRRESCFIAAHDARTGKEVWKFYTTPAPGEPGGDSWGNVPVEIPRGQERDITVSVGEPGGIFALDRATGEFLLGHTVSL